LYWVTGTGLGTVVEVVVVEVVVEVGPGPCPTDGGEQLTAPMSVAATTGTVNMTHFAFMSLLRGEDDAGWSVPTRHSPHVRESIDR
jgi:hypothetical protein